MTEAEEVDTTEIDLGRLHESGLLYQTTGQMVVHFHIAEFQESTVTLPERAGPSMSLMLFIASSLAW